MRRYWNWIYDALCRTKSCQLNRSSRPPPCYEIHDEQTEFGRIQYTVANDGSFDYDASRAGAASGRRTNSLIIQPAASVW